LDRLKRTAGIALNHSEHKSPPYAFKKICATAPMSGKGCAAQIAQMLSARRKKGVVDECG
jgi:hypothetical protein